VRIPQNQTIPLHLSPPVENHFKTLFNLSVFWI